MRSRILARQRDDVGAIDSGERFHALGRILSGAFLQRFKSGGVVRYVIGVVQIFGEDYVHQTQRQRQIAAGENAVVFVRQISGASANRIDGVELRAIAPGLHDEGPEMHAGGENVCTPGNNEFRMAELFGFGSVLEPQRMHEARAAGGGTDGSIETRSAQAMEKAAVHAGAVQEAHGPCVAVRQDGL